MLDGLASAADDLSAALPQIDPNAVFNAVQVAALVGANKRELRRWRLFGLKTPTGERVRLKGFKVGQWRVTGRELIEFLRALQPSEGIAAELQASRPRRRSAVDAALREAGF